MNKLWKYWILSLALTACGGGGGTQTAGEIGTAGTGATPPDTVGVGPVVGFGSVIVGNIRYDDTSNTKLVREIEDNDDSGTGAKLGMNLRIEAKLNSDSISAVASKIELAAEIRGVVESVDAVNTSFKVMNTTVKLNATTLLDGLASINDLSVSNDIQVHGSLDSTGAVVATRVQKRSVTSNVFKTVGYVAAVPVPTATDITLTNGLVVKLANATVKNLPSPIPANTAIRVKTNASPAQGSITATQVRPITAPAPSTVTQVEVKAVMTELSGTSFKLENYTINVNASTRYTNGSQADLAIGKLVEVYGSLSGSVITASTLKFEASGGPEYKFIGPVTNYVSASDFQIKGQQIDATSPTLDLRNGTLADLNNAAKNQNVEVRGSQITNGKLLATRLEFK